MKRPVMLKKDYRSLFSLNGKKINGVPVGLAWYNEVKAYEEQVLSQRN